jgi:Ca2+-binding EF-hand superfamily protein
LNNDGLLNYKEYTEAKGILRNRSFNEQLEISFDVFDSNNDGVLSRDEIKIAIISIIVLLGLRKTDSFIDELTEECINELDFDKDRNVTKGIKCLRLFLIYHVSMYIYFQLS